MNPLEAAISREEVAREEVEVEAEATEKREREKERRREGGVSLGKDEGGRRRSNSPASGISAMVLGLGFNRGGEFEEGGKERER